MAECGPQEELRQDQEGDGIGQGMFVFKFSGWHILDILGILENRNPLVARFARIYVDDSHKLSHTTHYSIQKYF